MTDVTDIRRPQAKRQVEFAGVLDVGATRLKMYHLFLDRGATGDAMRSACAAGAEDATRRALASGDQGHGLGYAMLHFGEHALWLLVGVWREECLVRQKLFRAEADGSSFVEISDGTIGCAWELCVTCHERGAWMRHVLYSDGPDPVGAYLADTCDGMF